MAQEIIEVSGPDYIGKSTQAEMLTYETWHLHAHNFGSFGSYGTGVPTGLTAQEHFNWWFRESSADEMAAALTSAYLDREQQAASSRVDLAICERGSSMIRAQLAANFATRMGGNVLDHIMMASELIDTKLSEQNHDVHRTEIILEPDSCWQGQQEQQRRYVRTRNTAARAFTAAQNEFYDTYLQNLGSALRTFPESDSRLRVTVNSPAVDVQNSIRTSEMVYGGHLPSLLPHEPIIVGLAGLSESGKGRLAEILQADFQFTRLKLGYFNESLRKPGERYANPARIAMHIVRFLATNRHLKRVSLESLHGPQLNAELKLLIGERWKSVFIDVDETKRQKWLQLQHPDDDVDELLHRQQTKDTIKRGAGVEFYRKLADIVIENSGTPSQAVAKIMEALV